MMEVLRMTMSLVGAILICLVATVNSQDTRDTDNRCSFAADGQVYNIEITRGINPQTCPKTDQLVNKQKKADDKLNEVIFNVLQLQSNALHWTELNLNLSRQVKAMEEQQKTTKEALGPHQAAASDCPSFYDVIKVEFSSCYLFVCRAVDWYDAESYCMSTGGHLVALESQGEQDFIVDYINKSTELHGNHMWTGGNDIAHENQWVWAGINVEFNYTSWMLYPHSTDGDIQMPDNHQQSEHCMHLFHPIDYQWNDVYCGSKWNFICEFKLL